MFGNGVGIDQRDPFGAEQEVVLERRRLLAAADFSARCLPGLQAAIEHGNVFMAGPLEHPPQAAAVVAAVAVIHHGLHVVAHANAGQPGGKLFAIGQRMAPARGWRVGAAGRDDAVRASDAVTRAERGFQVGVNGAVNVRGQVLLVAGMRLRQVKTAVKHAHQRIVLQQGLQLFG